MDPKLDFVLSKSSRSTSLRSCATTVVDSSNESIQFDEDDLMLVNRLSLQRERNDNTTEVQLQQSGEDEEEDLQRKLEKIALDAKSADEVFRGRTMEIQHSASIAADAVATAAAAAIVLE
jgi:hypothetical protein